MYHSDIQEVENIIKSVLEIARDRNEAIYSVLKYSVDSGGKRIRPAIALFCADVISDKLGGYMQKVYISAACIELLHTASLILDDIIDEADIRRGKPASYKVFGTKVSVIASAYLLGVISEMISTLGSLRLVNFFSSVAKAMAEGQILESKIMIHNIVEPDVENLVKLYFQVIEKKTASLFKLSSSLPFVIYEDMVIKDNTEDAKDSNCRLSGMFSEIGRLIGILFQIKDDILDFTSLVTGKPILNDIKEGKLTLPVLLSENFDTIFNIVKSSNGVLTSEKLWEISRLVREGSGLKMAENELMRIRSEVQKLLRLIPYSEERKNNIYKIIDFISARDF